jgi:cytochrome oxidase Cu insertion factor (SCO1/SenC/PrrC family)
VPSRPLRLVIAIVALGGVTAAIAVAALLLPRDAELPGVARDPAPRVHGLTFDDVWDREEAVPADLVPPAGGVTAAYFGYLSCPDMCPLTMGDLRRARELLGDELADRTTIAFVTLDPARDGPEQLQRYLGLFFDRGVRALTAPDEASLAAAAERLGVRYERGEPDPDDGRYEVAHSAITYVIDDRGVVVRELPFGTTPEEYAAVLRSVLDDHRP